MRRAPVTVDVANAGARDSEIPHRDRSVGRSLAPEHGPGCHDPQNRLPYRDAWLSGLAWKVAREILISAAYDMREVGFVRPCFYFEEDGLPHHVWLQFKPFLNEVAECLQFRMFPRAYLKFGHTFGSVRPGIRLKDSMDAERGYHASGEAGLAS